MIGCIEGGGTKFVCGIFENEKLVEKKIIKTKEPIKTMEEVISFFEKKDITSLSIGTFGPLQLNKKLDNFGSILNSPRTIWKDFNIYKYLKDNLNIEIMITTDVNIACLGEKYYGLHKDINNLLYITIGTGIGAGFLYKGNIYQGINHSEMGHVICNRYPNDNFRSVCAYHNNCAEGLVSGPAINQRYPDSKLNFDLIGYYIASMIIDYTYILMPERIIIGGGIGLISGVIEKVRSNFIKLNNNYIKGLDIDSYIQTASLKSDAGIYGAFAFYKLNKKVAISSKE